MVVSQNEIEAAKGVRDYGKYSIATCIVAIVAAIFFYIYLISYSLGMMSATTYQYPPSQLTNATNPFGFAIWIALLIGVIVLALGVIALFCIHKAFSAMAKDDNNKFGRPLMMVRLGIAMLVIGVALTILGSFSMSVSLVLIGIILAMVGGIMLDWGIALGLWRFGSETENAVLKIGSITAAFSTLPGLILVYLGAGEVEEELGVQK
jgi:hypothetical protein